MRHEKLCKSNMDTYFDLQQEKQKDDRRYMMDLLLKDFRKMDFSDANARKARKKALPQTKAALKEAEEIQSRFALLESGAKTKLGSLTVNFKENGKYLLDRTQQNPKRLGKSKTKWVWELGTRSRIEISEKISGNSNQGIWQKGSAEQKIPGKRQQFMPKTRVEDLETKSAKKSSFRAEKEEKEKSGESDPKRIQIKLQKNRLIHEESINQSEDSGLYLELPPPEGSEHPQKNSEDSYYARNTRGRGSEPESSSAGLDEEVQSIRSEQPQSHIIKPRVIRMKSVRDKRKANKVFQSMQGVENLDRGAKFSEPFAGDLLDRWAHQTSLGSHTHEQLFKG